MEGSSRLLQELGAEGYAETLSDHRRLIREACAAGGVEVDTQGDAFFFAFPSARDAVAAAIEAQAALRENVPLRVRIGIHTGEPVATGEGYVGIDVHRAARLAAAGHGGQILLSQATRELVDPRDLYDLGEHHLKDVGTLRLYQVGDEHFPPLRSLERASVPLPPTPLLGRKREVADLLRLVRVEGARLVTILGPGGIGKTRLAIEVGVELGNDYRDGAAFVDLAPVRDPQLVEPTIASTVGIAGGLSDYLRERELLLVLDNLEQVVDVAPDLGRLLEACPGVRLLTTSREPLRLRAEHEYPLRPLAEAPAVELFRRRAETVDPAFDAEYEQLVDLCERLERLPLAIELAAARVRMLSLEELRARLEQRLPLLTGGPRDAPERQRTLRATIVWSHDLLAEHEQVLFAKLAVFAGGWSLAAAEEVCDADLDTLQSLIDKSLIRSDEGRFGMLETIREYALERLEELEELEQVRAGHANHYLALVLRAEPELTGSEQHVWLELLATEYENIRTALHWFASTPARVEEGLRMAGALPLFWFNRSLYRDGLRWLEPLLDASAGSPTSERSSALWGAGLLWALVGDAERAGPRLKEALELARALSDDVHIARSLDVLGLLAFFANDIRQARTLLEESAGVARRADDAWGLADALGTLGSIYPLQGELDRANEVGLEAREIGRRFGDRQGIRMANFGLALSAFRRGRLDEARALSEEGLVLSREIGDLWFVSYFLWILALTAVEFGDVATAREHADESLKLARELEGPLLIVCALEATAAVARAEGDDDAARRDLEEAVALGRNAIVPDSYVASVLRALGEVAVAAGDLDQAAILFDESLARAEGVDDAWAAARAIASQGILAERRGDRPAAQALTLQALATQRRIGDERGAIETNQRLAVIAAGELEGGAWS